MISDEAVEAAATAAQHEYAKIHGRGERWEAIARAALEAAAPLIAAEAWDRCAASIVDQYGNPLIPYSNTNPYRSQT